jgi:hypothetical protein
MPCLKLESIKKGADCAADEPNTENLADLRLRLAYGADSFALLLKFLTQNRVSEAKLEMI